MPLLGHKRLNSRKVVETRQHLSVSAVRTAVAALHALRDHSAVRVVFFSLPPHAAVRARSDIVWMEHAVFLLVPLRGNVRVQRRKIVFTGQRLPSGADRTARAEGRPRIHRRAPRMAFWTAPPDFAPCAGDHLIRGQRLVLRCVPVFRNYRILSRERVFLRQYVLSRAVRTTAALRPRLDGGAVGVAFRASPPDELVAAESHIIRREW